MNPFEPRASRLFARDDAAGPSGSPSRSDFVHWDVTEDALFTVAVHDDGSFTLEGINPACQRMIGLSQVDVAGKTAERILPPAEAALVLARYRQCVSEGRAITYLETLKFPTGTSDWRTSLEPVRDASGRIFRLLGRARRLENLESPPEDLTEGEFRKALDIFPLGIALLDAEGVILYVNAAWRRFGKQHGSGTDQVGADYIAVCDWPTTAGLPDGAAIAGKLRQLLSHDLDNFGHPYRWKDRHFVLRATRLKLNGRVRVTMAHQDVTDVARAREEAARSMEQLLHAHEEERVRIALEVHDSTSQHLAALSLGLANLRRSDASPRVLADMRHALTEAQREIRTLSYLLYPPKLSNQGLVATLKGFVDGFRRRSGLSVVTTLSGDLDDLSFDLQRTVLRIVQEALANVHRHAKAQHVVVKVTLKVRGLRITVIDDGLSGRSGADRVVGVGIRGMQARFAQFGGALTVTHREDGTVVDGFLSRGKLEPADPATS